MNDQYYGNHFNPIKIIPNEDTDQVNENQSTDSIGDPIPMDNTLVQDNPTDAMYNNSTVAADAVPVMSPLYEPPARDIPVVGTPYVPLVDEKIGQQGDLPAAEYKVPVLNNQMPPTRPVVAEPPAALLDHEDSLKFRTHWNEIQATFVDEPRVAVQQADALVTEIVEKITTMFAAQHTTLDSQWNQGSEVSTEDLRKALQQYRAFFNRLVV